MATREVNSGSNTRPSKGAAPLASKKSQKLPNRVPPRAEKAPPNQRGVSRVKDERWETLAAVAALRKIDMSLSEIADLLGGVRRHAVHKWRTGKGRPSLIQRELIEKKLGIAVRDWLEPEEYAHLAAWVQAFEQSNGKVYIRKGSKLYASYTRLLGRRKKGPDAPAAEAGKPRHADPEGATNIPREEDPSKPTQSHVV